MANWNNLLKKILCDVKCKVIKCLNITPLRRIGSASCFGRFIRGGRGDGTHLTGEPVTPKFGSILQPVTLLGE